MTLRECVVKWDNLYRYDFWWRQKYSIPFNSEQHRAANQLDIAFEYFENAMSNKALEKYKEDDAKKEELKKTGQWLRESEGNKEKLQEAFDKLNLKDF